MTGLVEQLLSIQKTLKAPKGQRNDFGKYNYRSSEDILEAVKPLNAEKGLLLTLSDEPIFIGDWHYIKATATITNGADTHSVTAYARESLSKKGMDESQITGTASSYARKYALNGLYLIDDTKDADTEEYQKQSNKGSQNSNANYTKPAYNNAPAASNSNLITDPQLKALKAKINNIFNSTQQEPAVIYTSATKHFGINKTTKELTKGEASKIIDYLGTLE